MLVDFRMWLIQNGALLRMIRSLSRSMFKLMRLTVWRKSFLSGICSQCWLAFAKVADVTGLLTAGIQRNTLVTWGWRIKEPRVTWTAYYRLSSSQTSFDGWDICLSISESEDFFAVLVQKAVCTNKQMIKIQFLLCKWIFLVRSNEI